MNWSRERTHTAVAQEERSLRVALLKGQNLSKPTLLLPDRLFSLH